MSEPQLLAAALDEADGVMLRGPERHPRRNYAERTPMAQWLREAIIERDGRCCRLCGQREGTFQIDHIIPRSAFRKWELALADRSDNLQTACTRCNATKSNYRMSTARRTVGVTVACIECAPPRDWEPDVDTVYFGAWCVTCRCVSHVIDQRQIR